MAAIAATSLGMSAPGLHESTRSRRLAFRRLADATSTLGPVSNPVAPVVSALVSTYNAERFLPGCLTSLEEQTIADRIEIVIIDSGSSENEAAIAMSFAEEFGNVVYERTKERETLYRAWNRGLAHARGRYITNANTDDRWRQDAFEVLSSRLDERPDVALVYADSAITESPDESFESAPVVGFWRWPEFSKDALFRESCIGPHPMWRRSLHERYGAFDASFEVAGDYEWWLRIARNETLLHVPEALGLYYMSEHNLGRRNPERIMKEVQRARQLHWPVQGGPMPPYGVDYFDAAGIVAQQRQRQLHELRRWVAALEEARDWHHQQADTLRERLNAIEQSRVYRIGRAVRHAIVKATPRQRPPDVSCARPGSPSDGVDGKPGDRLR